MGFFKTEIEVSSSIELVWWAWTRKERLVQWFAPDATIEPYLGGAYELYFHPANISRAFRLERGRGVGKGSELARNGLVSCFGEPEICT
ncbi:SRPBCC domain-containing protein [Brevibacillus brevis]|uniref:SRPBCC family protein n=1 Tax=Brevibacillus brevis TaxID=1393 RepID=UPI00396587A1